MMYYLWFNKPKIMHWTFGHEAYQKTICFFNFPWLTQKNLFCEWKLLELRSKQVVLWFDPHLSVHLFVHLSTCLQFFRNCHKIFLIFRITLGVNNSQKRETSLGNFHLAIFGQMRPKMADKMVYLIFWQKL